MMKYDRLTLSRLKEVLSYNPETGEFTWLVTLSRRAPLGTLAGKPRKKGYPSISIDNNDYCAHILAWFYMTSSWPEGEVDHKNLNKNDTSWENLRLVTLNQNCYNVNITRRNKSGIKGVCWSSRRNVWRTSIRCDGRNIHVGEFKELEDAERAISAARIKYHGEFANFGHST